MKNIVICCDGTGNEYGKNNTNVVDFYTLALKSDKQIAFYDPGVGTGGWEYDEELGSLKAKSDQATGEGLQKNVEDAYRFLMKCYEKDDHVYLLGFSRGAFTARALGGMLYKCGLLRGETTTCWSSPRRFTTPPAMTKSPAASKRHSADPVPCTSSGSGIRWIPWS